MLPRLRRLLPTVPALALLGALVVTGAAPANAGVTGSTSTSDVVLYDRCVHHDIDYTLAISPGTSFWRLEIQVADPEGVASEGTVLSSTKLSPTSGTVPVLFCGSDEPGTWTVRATGLYQVLPGVGVAFALPDTRFQVLRAPTRTRLSERPAGHGRYRFAVAVKDQRPSGFRPTSAAEVHLEKLVHGTWRGFGPRLQTSHGRAGTVLAVRRGTRVRAVTAQNGNCAPSTSRPVRAA